MKTVITGANGQLGKAFRSLVPEAVFLSRDEFDLSEPAATLREKLRNLKPDVVINCAAYTKVDQAETEPELAHKINSAAVKALAEACASLNARFITYSTDYVFDGTECEGGYRESDPVNPRSVYGQSKVEGEQAITNLPNCTVIRTSWVFGDSANFVRTMLNLADKGLSEVSVVNDQIGRPTYAPDLAQATLKLLEQTDLPAIIHVTNEGEPTSWADLARETFAIADKAVTVNPISTEEFFKNKTLYAKRPHYSVLNLDLLHNLGVTLRPWQDALQDYLKDS